MNLIEILIDARNAASKSVAEVTRQLKGLEAGAGTAATNVQASATEMDGALATFSSFAQPLLATGLVITAAAGAVAGLAFEAVKAVRELSSVTQEMENMRAGSGMTLNELRGLELRFSSLGLSTASLRFALTRLELAISSHDTALKAMGITAKTVGGVLLQSADWFAKHADGANKSAYGIRLFGLGMRDMLAALNGGSEALRESTSQVEKMGLGLDATRDAALEANQRFAESRDRIAGMAQDITVMLLPAVSSLLQHFNDLLATLRKIPDTVSAVKLALREIFESIPGGKQLEQMITLFNLIISLSNAAAGGAKGGFPFGPQPLPGPAKVEPPPPPPEIAKKLVEFGPGNKKVIGEFLEDKFKADLKAWNEFMSHFIFLPGGGIVRIGGIGGISGSANQRDLLRSAVDEAKRAMAQVMTVSSFVKNVIQSGYSVLASSISGALDGILSRTMSFKAAMVSIFHSMVKLILDELAKIAAAKLWSELLSIGKALFLAFATGGASAAAKTFAIAGTGMGFALSPAPGGAGTSQLGGGSAPSSAVQPIEVGGESAPSFAVRTIEVGTERAPSPAGRTTAPVTNVYINATDEKSLNDAFRSARGAYNILDRRQQQARSF